MEEEGNSPIAPFFSFFVLIDQIGVEVLDGHFRPMNFFVRDRFERGAAAARLTHLKKREREETTEDTLIIHQKWKKKKRRSEKRDVSQAKWLIHFFCSLKE